MYSCGHSWTAVARAVRVDRTFAGERGIMTSVSYAYDDLMNPVIRALKLLGGSGTNEEINDKVAELLMMPAEQLEILPQP